MSAIRSMKMGPGILEIGESGAIANLARRCTNAILTPSVSREDPRFFLSGDEEPGDRTETWAISGTIAQDYGLTESTWEFLFRHRGKVMPFTYHPDRASGRPIKGHLIVEAVALGGDVNTKPTSDFEFPLVGAPDIETDDTPAYPDPEPDPEADPESEALGDDYGDSDVPAPVVSFVQIDDPAYIQAA